MKYEASEFRSDFEERSRIFRAREGEADGFKSANSQRSTKDTDQELDNQV